MTIPLCLSHFAINSRLGGSNANQDNISLSADETNVSIITCSNPAPRNQSQAKWQEARANLSSIEEIAKLWRRLSFSENGNGEGSNALTCASHIGSNLGFSQLIPYSNYHNLERSRSLQTIPRQTPITANSLKEP
jgi:hypothetical protein